MVEVKRVERLTPGCVRVTLTGPELEGFATRGPAEHIKVLFAQPGANRPELPEWGPDGPVMLEGQKMPPSRTYTPRRWDPATRELVVDFMLHGEGLASSWAAQAKPGDVVAVSGQPGGAYTIDPSAGWYLLGADESALPGLATILESLPASARAQVFVEVADAAEQQPLPAKTGISVTWLHRGHDGAAVGSKLEQALRGFEMPAGDGRVWLGCEASIMRSLRRFLIDERGMNRSWMHTHGYWKLGESNHPDHDVGQEI
jgi:NADPH-dependent ferric siderophore reductase